MPSPCDPIIVGGFGTGPFGTGPFGTLTTETVTGTPVEGFDLFCFEDCVTMLSILESPFVTTVDAGGQFALNYPDPPPPPDTTRDLGILSGELGNPGFPVADAVISIEPPLGVPNRWTTEWVVIFESLPPDLTNIVQQHVYLGTSDSAGPVGGLLLSEEGIAFTGSVHHAAGNLVLDYAVTAIPNTAQYITFGEKIVFRLVADGVNRVTYLFVARAVDVPVTGLQLVAILPLIDAADVSSPPTDQSLVSVRGTTVEPSRIALDEWCAASSVIVPNLPPVAIAGQDQALRLCSIAQLDGTSSFDPEGIPVTYSWRLIGAPLTSSFAFSGHDGRTVPLSPPTGFTDRFHSAVLGAAHAIDPLVTGDTLVVNGVVYVIVSTGTDGAGFFALVTEAAIPDNLTVQSFFVFRQRGLSGVTQAKPTFLPDVLGFYKFDLIVSDGVLESVPAVVVVNVVDSALPRGIVPKADFLFDYLSDYWSLVEDREPLATIWSGLIQIAASELYTLWQHEYSKSLRDIQRTFIRRWLHYDLVLGEPLPELTTTRVFYGGLSTIAMSPAGVGSVSGRSFTVSSTFIHPNRSITVLSTNPVTALALAAELRNRLLEVDPRYTTQVITRADGNQVVRINAPFPFSILNSTVPVLSGGASTLANGTGAALGTRTYRTDVSLDGLGLQENDLLVLGDQAFRVSQITSDPSDDFPFQRVVLKSDIPLTGVASWVLSGYVHSELLDFYQGLISRGDDVYFQVVDTSLEVGAGTKLLETSALGVSEEDGSSLAFQVTGELGSWLATPGRYTVQLAKVIRRTYLPIDPSIVDIPTLVELIEIEDDQATLRRNLDFFIEEFRGQRTLRFESSMGSDVWEGEDPPDRIWAEYTYLDNNPTIEANFGVLAAVGVDEIAALPGDVDYLSAVRGIWYAYINGPTVYNLRVGAQILLGLPFAEEAGVIEEIRKDFSPNRGRILVRDAAQTEIVRSYTFPSSLDLEVNPVTQATYAVGDEVVQFAPLIEGVEVVDYVKDPRWFQGLLNQGIFYEPQKFFQFLVRVDSVAFGVEPLLFTRDFLLKIKPTYTYPFFLVEQRIADTEISVTDSTEVDVTLRIIDGLCDIPLSSTLFDDPRSAGGGYWNHFDSDSDPGTPPPTPFIPDSFIDWGFDRELLCPSDTVTAHICQVFGSPTTVTLDSVFALDSHVMNDARFRENGPFTIATGGTGESITADVGTVVPSNGTITQVRLLIAGGPGSDPTSYELVVAINAVDTLFEAFTSAPAATVFTATVSHAVTAGQTLSARIRHAGGVARSPAWTNVRVDVSIDEGVWTLDETVPAGNYCGTRALA